MPVAMVDDLRKSLTPVHSSDAPSRSVLFSANQLSARDVGLDLASGSGCRTGVLVSWKHRHIYVTIVTPFSRMAFVMPEDVAKAVYREGSFVMIPEGQLPVTVKIRNDPDSALGACAAERGW
jgi:hypothetical protein